MRSIIIAIIQQQFEPANTFAAFVFEIVPKTKNMFGCKQQLNFKGTYPKINR